MPDYIDREELIRRIDMVTDTVGFPGNIAIKELIYNVPAADVAPVVHGRWENRSGIITCSGCGQGHMLVMYPNFCDNCGAKMDLEE